MVLDGIREELPPIPPLAAVVVVVAAMVVVVVRLVVVERNAGIEVLLVVDVVDPNSELDDVDETGVV